VELEDDIKDDEYLYEEEEWVKVWEKGCQGHGCRVMM